MRKVSLALACIGGGFAVADGIRGPLFLDVIPEAGTGDGAAVPPATPTTQQTATPPAQQPPAQQQGQQPPATGALPASQVQGLLQPLMQGVREQLQSATQPLQEQINQIQGRMDQLSQTQGNANRLFGGHAPGVRTGEDPLSSRGYQFMRAAGRMHGHYQDDQCKVELQVHQHLSDYYRNHGFEFQGVRANGVDPMLVPLCAGMIPQEALDKIEQSVGSLAAITQQGVRGFDPDAAINYGRRAGMHHQQLSDNAGIIRQAHSMFDDAALGILTEDLGELISLLRNREVLSRAGASTIALPPNGYLANGKMTGATTGYWVGESTEITESTVSTGRMEMRARKAGVLTTIPNEIYRFAFQDAEAIIRADITRVLSLLMDLAGLEGLGTATQPLGILNHAGIQTHTSSLTQATDGDTFNPDTPASMIADLEEANHDPEMDKMAWLMRPKMWKNIRLRRTTPYSGGAGEGTWLFDVNRSDISNGAPTRLEGYQTFRSTQISNTRAKGSSTDLSYVLAGIFKHVLIGRVGVMEFAMAVQGDTAFKQDQTKLRAIEHCDIGLRYENAFVLADKIDMDLPA